MQAAIPVSSLLDVNVSVPVAATSDKHQRSPASNDPNNKRQKITIPIRPVNLFQNEGVIAAMNKLTLLVEHHPHFQSKLEEILEDVFNTLEPEVSVAIRKQKNEDSCPIFKLSNDELMHVLGYVGKNQYGFVACVSDRFQQVYSETFAGKTSTSIECAAESVSRALLYLGMERLNDSTRANALFQAAAKDGHLDVLKWGQSYGYKLETMLDKHTFAKAALFGHLEVVKYLRTLGIPWDKNTCRYAARNGHFELLKWVRANECPWDKRTCAYAAMRGHLEILKWARANQCPWDEYTCSYAAANGHLELLKWCRANQCPWNKWTCSYAAANGHLDLLKWCRANQCPWDEATCALAAANGHLDLLKWCRANQCPWDEDTCTNAAAYGNLELLKWARANQCPWDEWTCRLAANNYHFELLKWARQNQCPWDWEIYALVVENHPDCHEW